MKAHDREMVKIAREFGLATSRTSRGHWQFTTPAGNVVRNSGTPGDVRAVRNLLAQIRRTLRAEAEGTTP